MYRIKDNPDSRFPSGRSIDADLGRWEVVHLRSRREKTFAFELAMEGIGYYLPLVEKRIRRRDNGKIRKSIVPLFPGYLAFVRPEMPKPLYKSPHISAMLKVSDQQGFVRELMQIQRILDNKISIETHNQLFPGEKVRVIIGPLAGIEGVIITCKNKTRLIAAVEMFNQSVSIEIQPSDVESLKI